MNERYVMLLIEGDCVVFYDRKTEKNIIVPWEEVDLYIYAKDGDDQLKLEL
ncbi:MAG: DUF956 family protein [Candidatus Omnitrophica bacterium]|nr:DUF956 family protein [Candidatus Omnitrophota bacterium]